AADQKRFLPTFAAGGGRSDELVEVSKLVRMVGAAKTFAERLLPRKPGVVQPPLIDPRALARSVGRPRELRHVVRKHFEALERFSKSQLSLLGLGGVTKDFRETDHVVGFVEQSDESSRGVKAATVAPQVPAFIDRL